MKKTYKQPHTEVVKINTETMCTESTFTVKGKSIDGSEGGFVKADKDYDDDFGDLW